MQYSDESQLTDEAASDAFTGTLLKLFNKKKFLPFIYASSC